MRSAIFSISSTSELVHLYLLVVGLAWFLEFVSVKVMSPKVEVSSLLLHFEVFFSWAVLSSCCLTTVG